MNGMWVKCDVNFTDNDILQMNSGILKLRLKCQIWGDDPVFDDHLFNYPEEKRYPEDFGGGAILPTIHTFFQIDVQRGLLNEDPRGGTKFMVIKDTKI